MAGWDKTHVLVDYEFTQLREEGRDAQQLQALRLEFEALDKSDEDGLRQLWQKMLALPVPLQLDREVRLVS